jgi:hypothetical protein
MHMTALLNDGIIPLKEFREDIYEHQREFTIDNEGNLYYTTPDIMSPYIPYIFRVNLLKRIHREYSYLKYPGL